MCWNDRNVSGMRRESNNKVKYRFINIGLVMLRKAISILDFIIQNESIESVKESYVAKQK